MLRSLERIRFHICLNHREQMKSNNRLWWSKPYEPHEPIRNDKNKVIQSEHAKVRAVTSVMVGKPTRSIAQVGLADRKRKLRVIFCTTKQYEVKGRHLVQGTTNFAQWQCESIKNFKSLVRSQQFVKKQSPVQRQPKRRLILNTYGELRTMITRKV